MCAIMRSVCVMCVYLVCFKKFRNIGRFVCYAASYVCVLYTCAIQAQNELITVRQADTSADPIEPQNLPIIIAYCALKGMCYTHLR